MSLESTPSPTGSAGLLSMRESVDSSSSVSSVIVSCSN